MFFLSDFPQVYIITDPRTQRSVREFRMAHRSLGGVHASLFALDFVNNHLLFLSFFNPDFVGRSRDRGMPSSFHSLLRSSGRLRGPENGSMHIARMFRMATVLLGPPPPPLVVLSFRIVPAHQSEQCCPNRVWWRGKGLRCVEEFSPGCE